MDNQINNKSGGVLKNVSQIFNSSENDLFANEVVK